MQPPPRPDRRARPRAPASLRRGESRRSPNGEATHGASARRSGSAGSRPILRMVAKESLQDRVRECVCSRRACLLPRRPDTYRMAMPATNIAWTVEMLDALPDDGQRYEIIDGELFVTPAPLEIHQL